MYTDSVFSLVCYIFRESFVEFWAVKLLVTLIFLFLGVQYYSGFTFISKLNDYVVSFSKIFESLSFLLGIHRIDSIIIIDSIIRSKNRLLIFRNHLKLGTLPKGYSPKINPSIGSNGRIFTDKWQSNIDNYGKMQLKLTTKEMKLLIKSLTEQSSLLKRNLKTICSSEVFHSLINKINITNEKFEQQLISRKDHKTKSQNDKCRSNSTPGEMYDLAEKHTRINQRKQKKNGRYFETVRLRK